MPEMNGSDLATQRRATRPDLSVLYMSGCASAHHGLLEVEVPLLPKPFTKRDLWAHVGALLQKAA
jgi:DNA-binding response OmpR family regulator